MDYNTRSYFIYFGLLIFCFFVADKAEKRNNKKYIFLIALALSLISGLRKNTVGIDTHNYYNMFNNLTSLSSGNAYNDPYFYKFAYLVMKINHDPYFVILVISCISNFLVVYRLWDYREFSSYKYAIMRYITLFYFFSFNCMRQFLSIAIVFWATKYLEEGKYTKYSLYVIGSAFIHIASLTALSFIIFDVFKWKTLTNKNKNFVKLSVMLLPVYILVSLNISSGRQEQYLSSVSTNEGYTSFILKIILFIAVIVFSLKNHNIFDLTKVDKNENLRRNSLVFYIIGLLLTGLGYKYNHFERIGYFFYIYATVYLGIAANEKRYRILFRFIILFIVIRAFYLNCAIGHGSMGQMPYMFNWE